MQVRTRFAPSPTGSLHLGSIRTAYFSWLYATKHTGTFEIRIEDTDVARNSESCATQLLEDLRWFGIVPCRVTYQSHNIARHKAVAAELETAGHAYRCYLTPEELEALRGSNKIVRSKYRDSQKVEDKPYAVRFKMPTGAIYSLQDHVQGLVSVNTDALDDPIILRSDGTPTYIFACMIDDHDAGITHVLRGTEHLSNTMRQLPIYDALGWQLPEHAHIPIVQDPHGNKLSKRTGAASARDLRRAGYLPEAILNAVLRMGWAHGDEEIVSRKRALELFSLAGINKSAARFDPAKLDYLNSTYMRQMSTAELWRLLVTYEEEWVVAGVAKWSEADVRRAQELLPEVAKRAATLPAVLEGIKFCCADCEMGSVEFVHAHQVYRILEGTEFGEIGLETALREFATRANLNFSKAIAQQLRLILTGASVSPSLFTVMVALGKDLVLRRIWVASQMAKEGVQKDNHGK